MKLTTSVRFCLSYFPLKWDFIALKMAINSIRKRSVDKDIVNDVKYMGTRHLKCYYTTCGHTIFMT